MAIEVGLCGIKRGRWPSVSCGVTFSRGERGPAAPEEQQFITLGLALFPLQPENTRIIFLKDCGPPVALATVFSAENNVGHPEVIPEVSGSL